MTTTRPRMRRSVSHSHVDWLRLVEVSGPFLSLTVLGESFPQGMERPDDDGEVAEEIRLALDAWEDGSADPAVHRALVRFVLERVLGYTDDLLHDDAGTIARWTADLREHQVALQPDVVIAGGTERPALLLAVAPAAAPLERPFRDGALTTSYAERMRLLLRAAGVRSGLLTNGERWMLVHVPPEGTATFATWDAILFGEERGTLRAFRSLLGARRVVGESVKDSLDGLLARSADDEREVTDALGDQARRAVEMIVAAYDAADRDTHGALLAGVEPPTLYEAAVGVVMRLIFLFTAEAQDLLPGDGAWLDSYAVSPMRAQLLEARGRDTDDVLARRFDAWPRLLATFRAVHGGVEHESVRLPGHGGGLFDPARWPFLEAAAGRVSNALVLRLLDNLQTLEVAVPGGRERRPLSFRALGVEQIGHVYERLLEHWAVRATDPALGLAGRKEPELALVDLEALGEADLIERVAAWTGRSGRAVMGALSRAPDERSRERLLAACDNDDDLLDRVLPFAGLVRDDHDGQPCVYLPGRVYVTERPGGRAFQSHYTPRSLTEPTVEYALEPLVYEGPAEGRPRDEWRLREPSELLGLRICDITVGSAAFLVASCRRLAQHLVESWTRYPAGRPPELPSDPEEQDLLARRLIAERCLYGVDKNPLAIEIAKVSLWLTTLRKGRPFTFLDHALRVGDSLVGITDLAQLEYLSLAERGQLLPDVARAGITSAIARARELRAAIAATDAVDLRQIEAKQALLDEVTRTTASLRAAADLVVFADLGATGRNGADPAHLVGPHLPAIADALSGGSPPGASLIAGATDLLMPGGTAVADLNLRPLHWPIEFPEVFDSERGGFDMIVGNPPFLRGKGISGILGSPYREFLVERVAGGARGSADLCAYFLLRAFNLASVGGTLSLLATDTVAQGDTREVGLAALTAGGATIFRAVPTRRWPGEASVEIAQVWLRKGPWTPSAVLAERAVPTITSFLARPRRAEGDPHRLVANAGRAFIGYYVLGLGFLLPPEQAQELIIRAPRNSAVLFPYLTGEDLLSRPDQSPSRWVINFFDWPIERAREYSEPFSIVEALVKPQRALNRRSQYRDRWWWFAERAVRLTKALSEHPLAFVRPLVSNTHAFAALPTEVVAAHKTAVFVADSWSEFTVLQSAIHESWAWAYTSTRGAGVNYSPSDCFETFPLPPALPPGEPGKRLHDFRAERTRERDEGLTALSNRVNDPAQTDDDIMRLRDLMERMDREVAAAYGWGDVDLGHGFHDTGRIGRRFTLSPEAREEVVDRLLELNHARYTDELARGLHAKKGAKGRRGALAGGQASLLGDDA